MFERLRRDIAAALERDPAAKGPTEVLLCYSGVHALLLHRIAHWLWRHGSPITARFLSQLNRLLTGIEIHPGAKIGAGLFIDHGTGVVIGETSEIGEEVTIYQGATLGGTGKEKGKRHPTIGHRAMIGAGSKVLGSITISDDAVIGANAVVLKPVPPQCTAVGVPARVVARAGERVSDLKHGELPDPVAEALDDFRRRIRELEARIAELEAREKVITGEAEEGQGSGE